MGKVITFVEDEKTKRQRIKEKYALDDIGDTWLVNKLCNPKAVDYPPSNIFYEDGYMWRLRGNTWEASNGRCSIEKRTIL